MLEWLCSAILRMVSGIFELFFAMFNCFLDLSLDKIVKKFPFLYTGYEIFCTIAFGLTLMLSAVQLFKFFTGNKATEAPHVTLLRAAVTIPLIKLSGSFIVELVNLAKIPYQIMLTADQPVGALEAAWGELLPNLSSAAVLTGLAGVEGLALSACAKLGASIVLIAAIGWNLVKLVIEICERYMMVGVLAYTSPLFIGSVVTGGTSHVFSKWCSMFFGQLSIMTMSIWSYNLVISGLNNIGSTAGEYFIDLLLILAVCRIGMRIDTYMQQLGIGVATTGGSLFDEAVGMFHTLSNAVKQQTKGGSKAEAGAKGQSNAVLGGHVTSDGTVRPEPLGAGVIGATRTAIRYGKSAWQNGGSKADILNEVKQGAKDGVGIKVNTANKEVQDMSFAVGRKNNNKIMERRANRDTFAGHNYGTVLQSGNDQITHLDQKAQANGLKINKDKVLNGPLEAAGGFMATNFDDSTSNEVIRNTLQYGQPEIAEAMFSRGDDFKYSDGSEISKQEYDRLGAEALTSMFGNGFADIEHKGKLTPEEQSAVDMGHLMKDSTSDNSLYRFANFEAGYVNAEAQNGWEGRADLVNKSGTKVGSMSIISQKAYDKFSDKDKDGYIPITSASGQQYYIKATRSPQTDTEYTAAFQSHQSQMQEQTQPQPMVAQPNEEAVIPNETSSAQPNHTGDIATVGTQTHSDEPLYKYFPKEMGEDNPRISEYGQSQGVYLDSDGKGHFTINGDDDNSVGEAIMEGLNSPRMKSNQIAENTINQPKANIGAMEAALYEQELPGIHPGHDQAVASMLHQVHSKAGIEPDFKQAKGIDQLSETAQSNFGPALERAAKGDISTSEYSVDGFSSDHGTVRCTYHTPEGDFNIASRQVISDHYAVSDYQWAVASEGSIAEFDVAPDATLPKATEVHSSEADSSSSLSHSDVPIENNSDIPISETPVDSGMDTADVTPVAEKQLDNSASSAENTEFIVNDFGRSAISTVPHESHSSGMDINTAVLEQDGEVVSFEVAPMTRPTNKSTMLNDSDTSIAETSIIDGVSMNAISEMPSAPKMNQMEMPQSDISSVMASRIEMPDIEIPRVDMSSVVTPQVEIPQVDIPSPITPQMEIPTMDSRLPESEIYRNDQEASVIMDHSASFSSSAKIQSEQIDQPTSLRQENPSMSYNQTYLSKRDQKSAIDDWYDEDDLPVYDKRRKNKSKKKKSKQRKGKNNRFEEEW